jgi:hypothetical protein
LFAHPKYDFIYTTCNTYDCNDTYEVDTSGYLSQQSSGGGNTTSSGDTPAPVPVSGPAPNYQPVPFTSAGAPAINYYDAQTDSHHTLTYSQARNYRLDTSSKSPEGYTLGQDQSGDSLFSDNSSSNWYLKNGLKKKRVSVTASTLYSSNQITFKGWVVP